jgi:hypothetical protein
MKVMVTQGPEGPRSNVILFAPLGAVYKAGRPLRGGTIRPLQAYPSEETLRALKQLIPAFWFSGEYVLAYKTKTGRMIIEEIGQY